MSGNYSSNLVALLTKRLETAIYADASDPNRLSVGLIGGDIPVFPPLAMLVTTVLALIAWLVTGRRLAFLPIIGRLPQTVSLSIRGCIMAFGVRYTLALAQSCEDELARVGTIPNFAEVPQIASMGPFSWIRNGMYLGIMIFQSSLAIGLNSGWLLVAASSMFFYLDGVVVPAEEAFLAKQLGDPYLEYCEQVPRWGVKL